MKRSTKQWLSVTAASLVFVAGCAAVPQRRPTPTPNVTGSTTGDLDACAAALGNMEPGGAGATPGVTTAPGATTTAPGVTMAPGSTAGVPRQEVTANGVLIGNVALVALPTTDNLPTSPTAVPGAPALPRTPAIPPVTVVPGRTTATPGAAAPAPTTVPGPGAAPGATGTDLSAVDRIRAACTRVVEIRVVDNATDRTRLAEIAMSMRKGAPITGFMDDISRMSRTATTAWSSGAAAPTTPARP